MSHDIWQYYCEECEGDHAGDCSPKRVAAQRAYKVRQEERKLRYEQLMGGLKKQAWRQVEEELPYIKPPGHYEL